MGSLRPTVVSWFTCLCLNKRAGPRPSPQGSGAGLLLWPGESPSKASHGSAGTP